MSKTSSSPNTQVWQTKFPRNLGLDITITLLYLYHTLKFPKNSHFLPLLLFSLGITSSRKPSPQSRWGAALPSMPASLGSPCKPPLTRGDPGVCEDWLDCLLPHSWGFLRGSFLEVSLALSTGLTNGRHVLNEYWTVYRNLQPQKLSHKQVKWLAWSHIANYWESWD